jgi:hypothetical protein
MTNLQFKKCNWIFQKSDTLVTIRWDYKGKIQVGWQSCKQYEVSCIIYNDSSGLTNKICEEKWITTLQPNYSNSLNYLKKILKVN